LTSAPNDWPFRCLGYDRGSYYYLPRDGGQVIELPASAHSKLNLLNLAPLGWWKTAFTKGSSFDLDRAADSLISQCLKNGVFDPDRIRGRGAWYDANRVILHLGNRLSVISPEGEAIQHAIDDQPPSYYFYENAKPLTGPAEDPLSDDLAAELLSIAKRLEQHYRDMQDVEFTIERGKLWMLQTRSGKRTAKAALKMAVDMVGEGLIDEREAVRRVDPMALDQLLHPTLDPKAERHVLTTGLPASPGAAAGKIVLDADTEIGRAHV
jgi:hypothetical protein